MDLHTDREIQLSEESEHTSLYSWFLHEASSEGPNKGLAQLPWVWGNYFTATKVAVHRTVEIDAGGHKKFGLSRLQKVEPDESVSQGVAGEVRETEAISASLVPGMVRDGDMADDTRYSMFGTSRTIRKFSLRIVPLPAEDTQERCHAWGCVSYTTDIDFRDVTFEDELQFSVFVTQERFDRLKAATSASNGLLISVAGVSGFYSEWSPSISTSRIKVLTSDSDHALIASEGSQIKPPRLGRVAEFHVTTSESKKLELELRQSEPDLDTDEADALDVPPDHDLSSRDQLFLAKLDQLGQFPASVKFALWGILMSLVLLLLK